MSLLKCGQREMGRERLKVPNITRLFQGKEYQLEIVTLSKRSAAFVSNSYRKEGFFARVTKIANRRFGIWLRARRNK